MSKEYFSEENTKKIQELFLEYCEEIFAKGAWGGHTNSQSYLSNVYDGAKEQLRTLYETICKKYHHEFLTERAGYTYDLYYLITSGLPDYYQLTEEIRNSNMPEVSRCELDRILEKLFEDDLKQAFNVLNEYYEAQYDHSIAHDVYHDEDDPGERFVRILRRYGFMATKVDEFERRYYISLDGYKNIVAYIAAFDDRPIICGNVSIQVWTIVSDHTKYNSFSTYRRVFGDEKTISDNTLQQLVEDLKYEVVNLCKENKIEEEK